MGVLDEMKGHINFLKDSIRRLDDVNRCGELVRTLDFLRLEAVPSLLSKFLGNTEEV